MSSMAETCRQMRDYVALLARMEPDEQRRRLAEFTPEQLLRLDAAFEAWAHESQLPPSSEGWRTWLMQAGRGFGKTRAGAEWIHQLAYSRKVRIALVGATVDEARRVMVEGVSGLLSVARRWGQRLCWEPSKGELTWQRGSVAQLFSGENADGLRGPEHHFAWFLTFEVEADEPSPTLGAILQDTSRGAIQCTAADRIVGYAAYGRDIKSAVQPLVDHFGIALFDDGGALRSPAAAAPTTYREDQAGCTADPDEPSRLSERSQAPARTLPASLTISYYDPARDYQTGQMRASAGAPGAVNEAVELPVALIADQAKALAQASLARRWADRELLKLRLAPSFIGLQPGALVAVPDTPVPWKVRRLTIDGGAVLAELSPEPEAPATLPAEPGRSQADPDIVAAPTSLAVLDLPDLGGMAGPNPTLLVAAASPAAGWRAVPLEIVAGDALRSTQTAFQEAVLGTTATTLAPGPSSIFDAGRTVTVELVDPGHWLESRSDVALSETANLAAIGRELIQFAEAVQVGPRSWMLSGLLRGRRGTEWAIEPHPPGTAFVLLKPEALRAIPFTPEQINTVADVRALGLGDGSGTVVQALVGGEALRPPSPVHLRVGSDGSDAVAFSWVRRSRSGWAWIDEVDAPLGESRERYRLRLAGGASSLEIETEVPETTIARSAVQALGAAPYEASVMQVGDHAVSRPTIVSFQV
jgi:hypothetical protein